MRRAGFSIFTVVAAIGLVLAVATVVLWIRSHRPAGSLGITDSIDIRDHDPRYSDCLPQGQTHPLPPGR